MPDTTKRLRYFNQQFLEAPDFTDEQNYHLDRRRRHNHFLHTPGIATGLEVIKTDDNKVKVTAGTAIDIYGREIVQDVDSDPIELSDTTGFPKNSNIYITIKYFDEPSDKDRQSSEQSGTETRFIEKPNIRPYQAKDLPSPTDDPAIILLAKFDLIDSRVPGNQGDKFDNGKLPMEYKVNGVRKTVGAVLADRSVPASKLKTELVQEGDVELDGGLANQASKPVDAYTTTLDKPNSAFILVYAYAKNIPPGKEAKFTWTQDYITNATEIKQVVTFTTTSNFKFLVHYRIYSVLES